MDTQDHHDPAAEAQVCYTVGLIFLAVLVLLFLLGIFN
jgi:hypothetical protein